MVNTTQQVGYKEARRMSQPAWMNGLIEGGMLAPRLSRPHPTHGYLDLATAAAGEWVAYDAKRRAEFPHVAQDKRLPIYTKGKLMAFLLDEVIDNEPSTKTPTDLLLPFSADHLLTLNSLNARELVEIGFATFTTHELAYEQVGLEALIPELRARSMADAPVYQITPKGNTLVKLVSVGGTPQPKQQEQPDFSLRPGFAFS